MRLVSIDPSRNRFRYYEVHLSPNLLEGWSVIRQWGRIGRRARMRIDLHDDRETARLAAEKLVRRKLRARGYSPAPPEGDRDGCEPAADVQAKARNAALPRSRT
jgi:predicted DNA-binding WGR domain protein